jgi:hypothetical protein
MLDIHKLIRTLLCFILLIAASAADSTIIIRRAAVSCPTDDCVDFEETGKPSSFTDVTACDYDYDVSGKSMNNEGLEVANGEECYYAAPSASDEIYFVMELNITDDTSTKYNMFIRDSGSTAVCWFGVSTNSDFFASCVGGSGAPVGVDNWTNGTTKTVRLRYKKGTGSNAECGVSYWDSVDGRWEYDAGSVGEAACTDGTATTQGQEMRFKGNTATAWYADDMQVDDTDITDPTTWP